MSEHRSTWKGGRDEKGYIRVCGLSDGSHYRREHRIIAEQILGHPLPPGAVVHHIDDDGSNNATTNLVILQSGGEHRQLHYRLRVLRAGGNPWTDRLCFDCGQPKSVNQFSRTRTKKGSRYMARCRTCVRIVNSRRYRRDTDVGTVTP